MDVCSRKSVNMDMSVFTNTPVYSNKFLFRKQQMFCVFVHSLSDRVSY